MARPAVFIDRDGVLNAMVYNPDFGTVDSPSCPEQAELLPGAAGALAALNRAGLPIIVATNQPGVAKGKITAALQEEVAATILRLIHNGGGTIDATYTCPHHPDGVVSELAIRCICRKPAPGLLVSAAADLDLDLRSSWMVGDGVTDVDAGAAAGVRTILVSSPKAYICERLGQQGVWPDYFAADLREAVTIILNHPLREGTIGSMQNKEDGIMGPSAQSYVRAYLEESAEIARRLDRAEIERIVALLLGVREAGGRLFILGVGGGAGHASHAVNDFRKIVGLEAYAPTDNVSELTARINDNGWESVFADWLRVSRLSATDAVLVFSVGGGDLERNISPNLVRALEYARGIGATITGVVGRDGGYTAKVADACVIVPVVNPNSITPHTEAFQAVVWHLIVSHPHLMKSAMKWESSR